VTGDADPLAGVEFEDVLREVINRVHGVLDEQARWELLLDAVVTMAADLSLDGLLSRIVEAASDLAGARYAALGVLGSGPGKRLRTFVTHGIPPAEAAEIGPLPTGHGLLGTIIDHPEPLRLHEIAAHPVSYGFPANHPPMRSFLGVPVRIRDKVFGNLYLTEKAGGDFTEQDERIVVALAAAAGVAIENARLYEEAARRERWLAATAEVTSLLAADSPRAALEAVVRRALEVAEADAVWLLLGDDADSLDPVASATAWPDSAAAAAGELARTVTRTGVPQAVEELDPEVPRGPAVCVPVRGSSQLAGALVLAWSPERGDLVHELDPALPGSFAEQIAVDLELGRARDDHERLALFEDRDRIGRDLHDLVIQRLFAVGLSLQSTSSMVDRPEARARIETAVDDLDATIMDIRRSIFALGSTDDAPDIQAELTRMVERATATLKFRPELRFEGPVRALVTSEVAPELLAVLGEALSNAARHAQASSVSVVVTADDEVTLTVTDDGRGIQKGAAESGLSNMRQRAERLGGTFTVRSGPPLGTTLVWSVPTDHR
jgi:signal transduction histidine kinase